MFREKLSKSPVYTHTHTLRHTHTDTHLLPLFPLLRTHTNTRIVVCLWNRSSPFQQCESTGLPCIGFVFCKQGDFCFWLYVNISSTVKHQTWMLLLGYLFKIKHLFVNSHQELDSPNIIWEQFSVISFEDQTGGTALTFIHDLRVLSRFFFNWISRPFRMLCGPL